MHGGVGPIGWYYIAVQVLMMWVSFRSRGKVARMATLPSRTRHFASVILMQVLLISLTLLVAQVKWIPLFPRTLPKPLHVLAGIAVALIFARAMYPLWKRTVAQRTRRAYFFMPSASGEKALWSCVSLAAGIGEELTYRGVLHVLLTGLTGSARVGALLSALIFAGGHAFQSRLSMAIIFCFALTFQALAFWTGALYVPMLAHVLYDLIAGFSYSRLGREMGYRAEGEPGAAGAVGMAEAPGAAGPARAAEAPAGAGVTGPP